MKIVIVEDNLVGFLTAIYKVYYDFKDVDKITSDLNVTTMLDDIYQCEADTELASKVRSGIIKKVKYSGYYLIRDAYLSCDKDKEQKIYQYLKLLFKIGDKVYTMFSHPDVIAFNDMLKKVRHEVHRMHGFLRFQEMDNGIYYAYFSGDNDILELMLPHFTARFNDQQFVIHDIKRNKMAYHDGAKCHTLIAPDKVCITLSDREKLFSELWRDYNKNVSIDSRINPRLQNHYAPKKYRWFMNEF